MTARILVVGDRFCPSSILRDPFAALEATQHVMFADVVDEPAWLPVTASELHIREYMGSPDQVIRLLDRHDVLVVQGAPVTETVLDAAPELRLICCARGGPVNVDLQAATARAIPVVTTPGKNADAVAELTLAFLVMLARRLPEVMRHVEGGGEFAHDNYEGASWFGHDLRGQCARPRRVRPGRPPGRLAGPRVRHARGRVRSVRRSELAPSPTASSPWTSHRCSRCRIFVSLHARATADELADLIGPDEVAADEARRLPRQHRARRPRGRSRCPRCACERAPRRAAPSTSISPSPATGRHPLLAPPECHRHHRTSAARRTRRLRHGGEMAVAEIERLPSRRAAAATSPIARRLASSADASVDPMSHTLAIDLGTGSCRAVLFDADGAPGRDRPARVVASAALPDVPGSQVFDTDAQLVAASAPASARRSTGRRSARPSVARGEQHEHARGHGPLRRGRPRDLGLPERRRAGRGRGRRTGRAAATRGSIFDDGGDWVAITAARALPVDRARTNPTLFARDRPPGDAQRLGPLPAHRPVRHRPFVGFELGHVRPRGARSGRRIPRAGRPAAGAWSRRCSSRAASSGEVTARAAERHGPRGRDAGRRRGRRHPARAGRHRRGRARAGSRSWAAASGRRRWSPTSR